MARPAVWISHAGEESGLHRCGNNHFGVGHWREHGALLGRGCDAVKKFAGQITKSAGALRGTGVGDV